MTGIFDSHAHYYDAQFAADRDSLLQRLPEEGVCGVVNAGSCLASSEESLRLAARFPYIYAAVGCHPEAAERLPCDYLDTLARLASSKKAVAIGEIGLDYYYEDACPREKQKQVFEAQLALAKELDLPVVVHDRDAHLDTITLLRKYRPRGVIHCFSGSSEMAAEAVKLGLFIGLGGAVTFKNARHAPLVAKSVPMERILLETDAPYLAPIPFRGKRCDSRLIAHTAEKIAELRHMEPQAVIDAARANTLELFQIEENAE